MSYDIKLQNKCDHRINWEQYPLGSDLKSVKMAYPVASVSALSLRINNVVIDKNQYTVATIRKPLSLSVVSELRLRYKVKDWIPLVEVNYTTFSNVCPKCLGLNTADDLLYGPSGDYKLVKKEYLLLQSVEKVIVTKVSSNPFHGWYGTGLHSLIGSKTLDFSFIKTKIIEQVSSAIEMLKNLQKQLVASGRQVDPGELFGQLLNIDVQQSPDPTIIMVNVIFTSQSNQTLEFSQLIDLSTTRERVAFA